MVVSPKVRGRGRISIQQLLVLRLEEGVLLCILSFFFPFLYNL